MLPTALFFRLGEFLARSCRTCIFLLSFVFLPVKKRFFSFFSLLYGSLPAFRISYTGRLHRYPLPSHFFRSPNVLSSTTETMSLPLKVSFPPRPFPFYCSECMPHTDPRWADPCFPLGSHPDAKRRFFLTTLPPRVTFFTKSRLPSSPLYRRTAHRPDVSLSVFLFFTFPGASGRFCGFPLCTMQDPPITAEKRLLPRPTPFFRRAATRGPVLFFWCFCFLTRPALQFSGSIGLDIITQPFFYAHSQLSPFTNARSLWSSPLTWVPQTLSNNLRFSSLFYSFSI